MDWMCRLAIFDGGRKRKIRELRARAAVLGRLIAECQRALADCAPNDGDVGGYRAVRGLRAAMLESELAAHRSEMDAVAEETIGLEEATRSQARERRKAAAAAAAIPTTESPVSNGPLSRTGARLRWVAVTIGIGVLLLAAAAPAAEALGSISMLMAPEEDVIEVDPRSMGWTRTPAPYAGISVVATAVVAGAREQSASSSTVDPQAVPSDPATEEMGWASLTDQDD